MNKRKEKFLHHWQFIIMQVWKGCLIAEVGKRQLRSTGRKAGRETITVWSPAVLEVGCFSGTSAEGYRKLLEIGVCLSDKK